MRLTAMRSKEKPFGEERGKSLMVSRRADSELVNNSAIDLVKVR
jgi:hypothetical protein